MRSLHGMIDTSYQLFHRAVFGIPAEHTPPLWLWISIATVTLIRLVPATYSQWEDPIFALVTEVNAPWNVTFGFGTTDVVHILYCVLAKILIKATGHHWVDFVFRIPSLVAAFLVMPLGFAVFSRIRGRVCATLFGLCTVLLPTFTRFSVDSRAYMVMMCVMIWALGLTPGLCSRVRPFRLATAYFLVGINHGLGIFMVGCFGILGCFTGTVRHRRLVTLENMLLTLPVFIFTIPTIRNMLSLHGDHIHTLHHGILHSWIFVPRWFDYQFGTPLLPWISPLFLAAIVTGLIVTFRESWKTGCTLLIFIGCIPALFGITGNNYTLERYSMITLPFLLWSMCAGFANLRGLLPDKKKLRGYAVPAFGALLLLTLPRTIDYLRYPEQDYRGVYQKIVKDYPGEKTVFGFAVTYFTGLTYYAEQFGLTYRVLDTMGAQSDSSWQSARVRCIIVAEKNDIRPEVAQWLENNAVRVKEFKGNALPTSLYVWRNQK
jgi:hypothetical protein